MHFEPLGGTMKKKTRARFSADFKLEAAQLVIDQNYSVREAAQAMGVGKSTMDTWVRQLRTERSGGQITSATPMTADQRKIKELEKRIEYIELEKKSYMYRKYGNTILQEQKSLKRLPHS